MAFYQLVKKQKLSGSIDEVWNFIASPGNLQEITPANMGFIITSNNGSEKMYPGMIITYKVSPLFGIKLNWVTEITNIKEYEYFIDEQRIGPYSMWHHQHKIESIDNGVLMTDIVSYQPPFGFIGAIANFLFIRNRLQQIFDFRSIALEKRFGVKNPSR
jgi:ligand-binding SRPBCC domain-containing protein